MFDQEMAENWCAALLAIGRDAWPEEQHGFGWAVWCEDAGLLFRNAREIKCWLSMTWQAEMVLEVIANG